MIVKTMDHLTKSQQKVYDFLRKEAPRGCLLPYGKSVRPRDCAHLYRTAHLKNVGKAGLYYQGRRGNRSIRLEGSEVRRRFLS